MRTLDIDVGDKAAIAAVQKVIRSEITLGNTTLLVAGDVLTIGNGYTAQLLMHGMTDRYTGEHFGSHIDRLHADWENADLAWKGLAALEGATTGTMHDLEQAMADVHQGKIDTLLRAGRDSGDGRDFFLEQLERINPAEKGGNS